MISASISLLVTAAEQQDEHSMVTALKTALETTGISTFAGALSTSLLSSLLIFAEVQSLAQFGVVAALGVFLAFLGAAWVLPFCALAAHG